MFGELGVVRGVGVGSREGIRRWRLEGPARGRGGAGGWKRRKN